MPIYAYKCESCGHAKDVLRKISDEPLTVCPECGKSTFTKQVTAAGFQLKGSGWYVTDFRGGNNGAAPAAKPDSDGANGAKDGAKASGESGKPADSAAASTATPAASAAAPAAAPATKSAASDSSSKSS